MLLPVDATRRCLILIATVKAPLTPANLVLRLFQEVATDHCVSLQLAFDLLQHVRLSAACDKHSTRAVLGAKFTYLGNVRLCRHAVLVVGRARVLMTRIPRRMCTPITRARMSPVCPGSPVFPKSVCLGPPVFPGSVCPRVPVFPGFWITPASVRCDTSPAELFPGYIRERSACMAS
jgi:hypothetical protein